MTPDLFPQRGSERSASARDWRAAQIDALNLIEFKQNWDGEDSSPVPKLLIDSTIRFFREMEQKQLPAPDSVYPLASGAVMAEWHYEDQTVVSAEIREPGKAEVLAWHPERKPIFRAVIWSVTPIRRRIVRVVSDEIPCEAWVKMGIHLANQGNQSLTDVSLSEFPHSPEAICASFTGENAVPWAVILPANEHFALSA